jgi:hypothetical protein
MSAAKTLSPPERLIPTLETTVRQVKARRWNAIIAANAENVERAHEDYNRHGRHNASPTAERNLLRALADYFAMSERARAELRVA